MCLQRLPRSRVQWSLCQCLHLVLSLRQTQAPSAKGICVSEISTSVVQLFQRNVRLPPAAQTDFLLPMDAGRSWQPALSQACQTQISSKDECSQEARDSYPTSRLIISYYFSRASTVLLKKQGAYFASCSMVYFKLRAVFVYIRS